MKRAEFVWVILGAALLGGSGGAAWATEPPIPVGHLATNTGDTSSVAQIYSQGITDALDYINAQGGVNGRQIAYETVDYGYDALRAVSTYADWLSRSRPVAILGWGTADTEALVQFVSRDQIAFMSGSSSGHLTDPTGRSNRTETPAPYNFFYGPSYSDGCRGLVQWAAEDWRRSGGARTSTFLADLNRPRFVHMGDNHPYPNAPAAACADYARDLGFEVLPTIRYPLTPGNFSAHCQALRNSGANYVFLGNTAESNVALVRACSEAGVNPQFLTNVYGWDENAARAAGAAGNGLVWVVTASTWTSSEPGMELVRRISQVSDPTGEVRRPVHYMRGVCTAYFLRDALAAASSREGGITGPNVKNALESMDNHVPEGLQGVCLPSTWTPQDHRGTTQIVLYRSNFADGQVGMTQIYSTNLPLRPDWLGY